MDKQSFMSGSLHSSGELLAMIGTRARQRRLALGQRQEDVAAASGVPVSTLRRFESGHNVGVQIVAQIAIALRTERTLLGLFPLPETRTFDEIVQRRRQRQRARRRR
jgi:transcriptional regulator with XRE-family HTH domain